MNDIEIMKKVNDIFLEGIMNDTIDVYEGAELINTSIELFSPEYMYESEELDDDEKAKKEKAKKMKKKMIKAIAIITSCLAALVVIEKIYKSKKEEKQQKIKRENEYKNEFNKIKEMRNKLHDYQKQCKYLLNIPYGEITYDDINNAQKYVDVLTLMEVKIKHQLNKCRSMKGKNRKDYGEDSTLYRNYKGKINNKIDEINNTADIFKDLDIDTKIDKILKKNNDIHKRLMKNIKNMKYNINK